MNGGQREKPILRGRPVRTLLRRPARRGRRPIGLRDAPALGKPGAQALEQFGLEKNNKLLFGISFGVEDKSDPSNLCRTVRAAIADNTMFHC